jgi:hypothetical protein
VLPGPRPKGSRGSVRSFGTGVAELDGATAWIPDGWSGEWRDGSLVVTRS